MKIRQLSPFTLSDFPGKMAAIVFTQGCSFRCPFCYNAQLLERECEESLLISVETVFSFLQQRCNQLDGVVISGGEPTLQTGLLDFIRQIKAWSFAVKVHTNGSRPDVIEKLIREQLVDFLSMDVKAPFAKYAELAGVHISTSNIEQSINLIAQSGIEHLFHTTFVPSLHSEEDRKQIMKLIPPNSPHVWQTFQREEAYDPALRTAPVAKR